MTRPLNVTLVVARAKNRVIGADGTLPWHLPSDLRLFKETTTGHAVIMGRKTFDSIPAKFRPLPNRVNVVLTRDESYAADGALVAHTVADAIALGAEHSTEVFVIGGGEVYRQSLDQATAILETVVEAEPAGDTLFPELSDDWALTSTTKQQQNEGDDHPFTVNSWARKPAAGSDG